jgi:DNA-binding MarR family transcriptional regulator
MEHIFRAQQDDNPAVSTGRLCQHVKHLQHTIDQLAELVTPHESRDTTDVPLQIRQFIRIILKLRASRRDAFGANLFGEPSWDILLQLYDAQFSGRAESVSSLCVSSGVPPTTALRWLTVHEREGQISRTPDPKDGRRVFINLTEQATAALDRIFTQLKLPYGMD